MDSAARARSKLAAALFIAWGALVFSLPLLGLFAFGIPAAAYFEFPPKTIYVRHASFSWLALTFLLCLLAIYLPFQFAGLRGLRLDIPKRKVRSLRPIIYFVLLCFMWWIAWHRYPVFTLIQEHTFFLLWMTYIAFCHASLRTLGVTSPLSGRPRAAFSLFLSSAGYWWLYEWLNRFVQNWVYRNVEQYSASEYFTLATLSFSTVLPAMLLTKELLQACLRLELVPKSFSRNLFAELKHRPRISTAIAVCSLMLVVEFPNQLFPFLWLSPLLLLRGVSSPIRSFLALEREEDFRELYLWSIAGLWCGILWELWNFKSFAGWIYLIPYVDRLHVFEMPLLGYAGYLPFGILCGLVCSLLGFHESQRPEAS